MTIPANRVLVPQGERRFERYGDAAPVPPLTDIQTRSYARFLQMESLPEKRTPTGLEGVLQEIFPIESYDKKISLDYVRYELGKPRYDSDECRQLRLTYGRPFKVTLRLRKADGTAQEEEVYLGDMPIMIGGGEFIINGAERVVVSQLHRSPGVDFVMEKEGDKELHSCRVIPERGSWIEVNVTKKDNLGVRIDQSGKFSAITLLRAMDPMYGQTSMLIREFYEPEKMKFGKDPIAARAKLVGDAETGILPCVAVEDVIDPETGEVYLDAGKNFTNAVVDNCIKAHIKDLDILPYPKDPIILASLTDDGTDSHEQALLKIYARTWKRPASCSRKSSSTPTATASAASAASASTGSSTRPCPKRK